MSKHLRGVLAMMLAGVLGACGGGGGGNAPGTVSGTVTALPGGDTAGINVWVCTANDCPYSTVIQQSGTAAAFSIPNVPPGQYTVEAGQDLNDSGVLDEGDAYGCYNETAQSCGMVTAPAANLSIAMHLLGGGGGGGGKPIGPGVTYLGPDDFQGGSVSLLFDDLGIDERVAIIPVHASQQGDGLDYSLSVNGLDTLALPAPQKTAAPQSDTSTQPAESRHLQILAQDRQRVEALRADGVRPLGARAPGLQTQAYDKCPSPAVGTQCQFWVSAAGGQTQITATVVEVSASAYWFVQNEDLADLSTSEMQSLTAAFEDELVPSDTRYFGDFSDIDGNGKIFIVFSELLAPDGVLGYVTGLDYFPDADTMAQLGAHSNEGDIFYAATPTSVTDLGYTRQDYFDSVMPATMVHELKHLIATGERILAGNPPEEIWIEEPSAQAAQQLAGYGDSQFYSEEALAAPQDFRLVYASRPPDPAEASNIYGYNFLFVWRLAEQVGHDAFWKAWTAGPGSGVANLEAHAGGITFPEMMLDWATTLMFDHTGAVSGYDYGAIDLRDGSWQSLGYAGLGNVSGTARSMAYYVGSGTGGSASVTISSASPEPYAVVVRFSGDLSWPASAKSIAATPASLHPAYPAFRRPATGN